MATIQEIEKQISDLSTQKRRIEHDEWVSRTLPQLESNKGNCYCYRGNSYGSGGKWDVFRRCVDVIVSEYNAWILFEQCQIDSEGKVALTSEAELISKGATISEMFLSRGWKSCPVDEFSAMKNTALMALLNQEQRKQYLAR